LDVRRREKSTTAAANRVRFLDHSVRRLVTTMTELFELRANLCKKLITYNPQKCDLRITVSFSFNAQREHNKNESGRTC